MKKLRVAIFTDGSGEPFAAEISRGLASRQLENETFLFPLSSILRPTSDFLDALKSLALTHALLIPHPNGEWSLRSPDLFLAAWTDLNKLKVHLIQATMPLPLEKLSGMFDQEESSHYRLIKSYNDFFASNSTLSFLKIADIDRLSSEYGRLRWFDSRAWEIAEIPGSLEAISETGEYLSRIISSSYGDIIKMVVIDLDQILWPEILDEVGPEGILKSSSSRLFLKFQETLLLLKKRGILISILSSNQNENVIQVFEQCSDLRLKLKDFAHVELGWADKVHGILKISEVTKIHPSHMLFIDDSLINQEMMNRFIPQLKVLKATNDPVHNIDELNIGNFFEGQISTNEDVLRTLPDVPLKTDINQFLIERNPELLIRKAQPDDVPRILQLHQRTNQFNARTKRASASEILSILDDTLVLSFSDKEQNYGIIGVVEMKVSSEAVIISDWLLSCRVFSRNIEDAFIFWLRSRHSYHSKSIRGELIATEKNKFIHQLYARLGFAPASRTPEVETWISMESNIRAPDVKIKDLTGIA